jgi:uncharacterized protein YjiK
MMEGIKYIGDGQFIVTEEWLREVYGLAVEMSCILITRMTMTVHRMSQRLSSMTG